MVNQYDKEECAGCVYANKKYGRCTLRPDGRDKHCRTISEFEKPNKLKVMPRNVKEPTE